MRNLLAGLTRLPFIAGFALAAQPVPLNGGQMDAVIAGAAGATVAVITYSYGVPPPSPDDILVAGANPLLNNLSARISPAPTPTPTPAPAYVGIEPGCIDCNLSPPPPPPPPPTPTQQFSSILSTNGIGLR